MAKEVLRPAPVLVRLPILFTSLFPTAERRVELSAETVGEMIDALDARWPGMRDRLCDAGPSLREHINVFVDGERASLRSPLAPTSEVYILPAVSGG